MTPKFTWAELTQEFFFRGALHGWAGGNNGVTICDGKPAPDYEDWKEATYREPLGFAGFEFSDRWGTDPESELPTGQMVITHWKIPVWVMAIGGGEYKEDVYPFLRQVLLETYKSRLFIGGRGLRELRIGNLLYTNVCEGNFFAFRGKEKIEYAGANCHKELAGFHHYWGGSLIHQHAN